MRMNQLFSRTLREAPNEADTPGYQLLLRAGFIRQHTSGVFSLLPLGRRTQLCIEKILHEEMQAIGGQEISMPIVQPAEIWKTSGRWETIGPELGRLKDRAGRELALAMTHEEVATELARQEIISYRDLPKLIYHIQTKWRDDPRPRAGLIRAREFMMKDSYSLDSSLEGLEQQYQAHYDAYFRIFKRCGLQVIAVRSDQGVMGGLQSHEFIYLNPIGEDTIIRCPACGYAANRQIAKARKIASPTQTSPLEKVATPDCKSIEALANFLSIGNEQTAKAVFLVAEMNNTHQELFVFAIVRGDMDVNETKLANVLGAHNLRPATEDEIRSIGAEPGYASPVGLKSTNRLRIVVDELIPQSGGLVAGANHVGYHLRNVTYGRDFTADYVADITLTESGDFCIECGAALEAVRGIEMGNIFKLGTHYAEKMGATFLDQDGIKKPIVMGSYGIGLGRLIGSLAEEYHDDKGLCWPLSVAPYPIHLVLLAGKSAETAVGLIARAEGLYNELLALGIECLLDDRVESPGVKFNDADLIGLPLRLTISERASQQGGIEFKPRNSDTRMVIPFENAIQEIKHFLVDADDARS
jgi:prolyl-tRNA synthetase